MSQKPLAGRICLVAGASRGIGRGIARALGEAGATVVVSGRSSETGRRTEQRPETIEDAAREVIAAGGDAHPYICDHRVEREVDGLVHWMLRRYGRIDCATSTVWSGFEGFDGETYADGTRFGTPFWRRGAAPLGAFMESGVYAGLLLARAVAPAMVAARSGLVAFVSFDTAEAYLGDVFDDLAKASLNRLAFACAEELREHGVTVLALSPGHVLTERTIDAGQAEAATETPLYAGRAVAALAADAGALRFSGQCLHVADLARRYGFRDADGSQPERFAIH